MASACSSVAQDAFPERRARRRCAALLENDLLALTSGLRPAILLDYAAAGDSAARAALIAARLRRDTPLKDAAACTIDGVDFVLASVAATKRRAQEQDYTRCLRLDDECAWAEAEDERRVMETVRRCALDACEKLLEGADTLSYETELRGAQATPPTLFGYLLKYPVLYVFADATRASASLFNVPLTLFELTQDRSALLPLRGPSFSTPTTVAETDEMREIIKEWTSSSNGVISTALPPGNGVAF